jgi:hypothetical protein
MMNHHQGAGWPVRDGSSKDEWDEGLFQSSLPIEMGHFPRNEAVRKGSLFYQRDVASLMDLERLPTNPDMMVNELSHPIKKSNSKHKQRRSLCIPPTAAHDRPMTDIRKGQYLIRKRLTASCELFWYGNLYTKQISAVKLYNNKCRL